jgi:hypothetical protein
MNEFKSGVTATLGMLLLIAVTIFWLCGIFGVFDEEFVPNITYNDYQIMQDDHVIYTIYVPDKVTLIEVEDAEKNPIKHVRIIPHNSIKESHITLHPKVYGNRVLIEKGLSGWDTALMIITFERIVEQHHNIRLYQ